MFKNLFGGDNLWIIIITIIVIIILFNDNNENKSDGCLPPCPPRRNEC